VDTEFETLLYGQHFKKLYEKMSNLITAKYGLHKIEIEILLFLEEGGKDTARDIAEVKYFSKANISRAIEHLTECGYLTGRPDAQDRRCVHLCLTGEAEPVCKELLALRRELMETIYQGITEEERLVMRQVARKIARNITAELAKAGKGESAEPTGQDGNG
jgi:Transcriptional regulators